MSGGTINTDRLAFGNNADATATVNMSGGTMNVTAVSAAGNRGALGLGAQGLGSKVLNLSGSALISAERLNSNAGGVVNLSGSAILNLKGSTIEVSPGVKADTAPTFSMTSAHLGVSSWASVLGTIDLGSFNTQLQVIGIDGRFPPVESWRSYRDSEFCQPVQRRYHQR